MTWGRAALGLWMAMAIGALPLAAEMYTHPLPRFSIDFPKGWTVHPGEDGRVARATGRGGRQPGNSALPPSSAASSSARLALARVSWSP